MKEREIKYWIIVASKDHVKNGVAQGIAQACHGKVSPLRRMKKGDYVIFYSGKQVLGKPDKCQEFTALGKVFDDEVYQQPIAADFCPSRRAMEFLKTKTASILPLINDLTFIQNKKK